MPERASSAATAVSLVFAVLFVVFAVWCGLRAADEWVTGNTGLAVLSALGALGGLSLGVWNFRKALVANRPQDSAP